MASIMLASMSMSMCYAMGDGDGDAVQEPLIVKVSK